MRVKREVVEACFTCPLCKKLLKDATTISLCLHSFCRKCIHEKFSDEEVDCCPVCNIDLGCLPVEKLRQDHNLQDIRAKIFPFKTRNTEAFEVTPSVALHTKRKERSLSSLVVSAPKVLLQTGLTGKRSKAGSRKDAALQGCDMVAKDSNHKKDSGEEKSKSSSSPEFPHKIVQNKRQVKRTTEPSYVQRVKEDMEEDVVMTEASADLQTPLNCLFEAANRTKCNSSFPGISLAKSEPAAEIKPCSSDINSGVESFSGNDCVVYMDNTENKDHAQDVKVQVDKNSANSIPSPLKRRRLTVARKKKGISEEKGSPMQVMLDASGAKHCRRNSPIWFSLVACKNQEGVAPLPQISTCYLRIKDSKMPVSFIQKYLVKKLDLTSESEVEIMCWGQPVVPTLQLHKLVDLWSQTASTSKKFPASVGSTAKDFVMVLSYCRKV